MYVYFANNLYLFDNKYYNNGDKMEKSHKIIIVGLVIVVIAMVAKRIGSGRDEDV